jgi:hypothetical protein
MSDDLLESAGSKYQAEWDDFENRTADGCLLAVPIIVSAAGLGLANRFADWLVIPLQIALIASFLFMGLGMFRHVLNWKCPRCRGRFRTGRRRNIGQSDACENCKLPRFYGSKRFIDLVGIDQARTIAQRIESE